MKVYVASSWRNEYQPHVVKALKDKGFDVYDFRHPSEGDNGFRWDDVDSNWKNWTPKEFIKYLLHSPLTEKGFMNDFKALSECDICILVMPCGRSSHWELGYAVGSGKETAILFPNEYVEFKPELMYFGVHYFWFSIEEMVGSLSWRIK